MLTEAVAVATDPFVGIKGIIWVGWVVWISPLISSRDLEVAVSEVWLVVDVLYTCNRIMSVDFIKADVSVVELECKIFAFFPPNCSELGPAV